MKVEKHSNLLKKLAGLVGIASAGMLIGIPAGAQSQGGGVLNPKPSIFNEPPYNGGGTTPTTPETAPTTPTPVPTTPEAPTTPSTPPTEGATPGGENVVALAASNGSFNTLTQALKAAGLAETLSAPGPYTIFAPTDAAFAALPPDALQELLKPENKELLVKILTYHVVPGKITSAEIKSGDVKTVEGDAVKLMADPGKGVMVNDATVVQPDLEASNGVIHAIDKVMLPPSL